MFRHLFVYLFIQKIKQKDFPEEVRKQKQTVKHCGFDYCAHSQSKKSTLINIVDKKLTPS